MSLDNEIKVHAHELQIPIKDIPLNLYTSFLQCKTKSEWDLIRYTHMKKQDIIDLCYKNVLGFTKTMEKKSKTQLISMLSPSADIFVPKYNWKPFHKDELLHLVKKSIPQCKKPPNKKNDLVRLLEEHNVRPPMVSKYLKQMNQKELVTLCQRKDGFDPNIHGKNKATMIAFLEPKEEEEEEGTHSPVHIENIVDEKENVEAIRAAILRILMSTDPFKADPHLEAKIQQIV